MRDAATPVQASIPAALWVQHHAVFPPGHDPAWLQECSSTPVSLPVGAETGTIKRPEEGHALARKAVEGEHSPALRVGRDEDAAFRLAGAAASGSGDVEDRDGFLASLPADYEGNLPLRELGLVDRLNAYSGSGSSGQTCQMPHSATDPNLPELNALASGPRPALPHRSRSKRSTG